MPVANGVIGLDRALVEILLEHVLHLGRLGFRIIEQRLDVSCCSLRQINQLEYQVGCDWDPPH